MQSRASNWNWLLWVAAFGLLAGLLFYPVNTRLIRLTIILLAGGAVAGMLMLTWRKLWIRWSLVAILAGTAAFVCGPEGNSLDVSALRADYLRRLQAYNDTRYYWGGENALGIDCSGLVRRGMIDALAINGVRSWNPGLVRKALWMWWNDASALELRDNRTLTTALQQARSVNEFPLSELQPGDLASNGTHIMAYLGEGRWIEADPSEERVIVVEVPIRNGWFQCPMTILRWNLLRNGGEKEGA